jgi:uncharacterized protein (TIGR00255 family)
MIKSMTGFGKAQAELENKTITVEIRSLNSKTADINLRLSSSLRNYELELRNDLSKQLERGKIDLSIYSESKQQEAPIEINLPLAQTYLKQLKQLEATLERPLNDIVAQVLKLPDVLKHERKETNDDEWSVIKKCIVSAIAELNEFRLKEGESLKTDFNERLKNISICLEKIKVLDTGRIPYIKEKIKNNIAEAVAKDKIDQNRLEQEIIYYIEKLDINEEKVRLKTHLDYFASTMLEASAGRKLNFIGQEIGREINTIGSKANDAEIQKLVVLMKDELEKIKEQTNNVL